VIKYLKDILPWPVGTLSPAYTQPSSLTPCRNTQLVVGYHLALILAGCIYGLLFHWMGSTVSGVVTYVAVVLACANLLIIRRIGAYSAAGNVLTALLFVCLTVMAWRSGGHPGPSLAWYATVPLVAMKIAGRRSAVVWIIIALLWLSVFYTLDLVGYAFPGDLAPFDYRLMYFLVLIGIVLIISGLAYMYETFRDQVTARLREEMQFSESAINSLPGVFCLIDDDGRMVRWNQNVERLSGLSGTELASKPAADLATRRDRPSLRMAIADSLDKGHASVEASLTSSDGSTVPHLFTKSRIAIRGRPYIVAMGVDITERKRAERAREAALDVQKRLNDLQRRLLRDEPLERKLEQVTEAVVDLLDADFCRIWITRQGDRCYLGCPHATVTDGPHVCQHRDRCLHLMASSGRYTHTDGNVHRRVPFGCYKIGRVASGEDRTFLTNNVTVDPRVHNHEWAKELGLVSFAGYQLRPPGQKTIGVMALFAKHPISAEEDALLENLATTVAQVVQAAWANEELRAARDAAEAASRAKTEFLANMSHEIRTPMTAILGFAEKLLDPNLAEHDRSESVNTIHNNGRHLLQIINDILDLSRIEAGKLDVEQVRCSLAALVDEVWSLMQVRADSKGLTFAVDYEGPVPVAIRTDPVRLKQVLINLIGNAIKFTEAGGVRLSMRFLPARPADRAGPAEPMIEFQVVDTGVGMSDEQMVEVFQPFHQADSSTTRKYGGSGLGLAISKRLVRMLNGDMSVKSQLNQGSTFTVTLPTGPLDGMDMVDLTAGRPLEESNVDIPTRGELPTLRQGCRILLAEDGPDNQRLIAYVLQKAGADVTIKDNGKVAMEAALAAHDKANPFDVILMDMQMPVLDGYQATRALRRSGYRGPIIALTAHAMASDRDKCLKAGCDGYATKPIDRAMLIRTIAEQLERTTTVG
jgi:PAS domain S-box-containing protein